MRLSKQSNYAVRALMYCAANGNSLSRIRDIGNAFGVSEMFLFKILVPVVRGGLLETIRGRNGGVRLGAPAEEISIMDVLRVTEDGFDLTECQKEKCAHCPLGTKCVYETALGQAMQAFAEVLGSYTIADLVADTEGVAVAFGLHKSTPRAGDGWLPKPVITRSKS